MSWNLIANADARKERETVLLKPSSGGDLRVALGYPNTYAVGMSNLGLQVVYGLFNSLPGVTCERFFLPEAQEMEEYRQCGRHLFTLESQRPVCEFDIVAFSLSYENDYVNLATLLELAGLPLFANQRGPQHPLVIAGGAISLLNPEPTADFIDAFCIGEAEPLLADFTELFRTFGRDKGDFLRALAQKPGWYIPSFWQPVYEKGHFVACEPLADEPENVICRSTLSPETYAATQAHSLVLTEDTELGKSGLVEVSRGCVYNCRFCTVGYSYPKIRWKPLDNIWQAIESMLPYTNKVGLISATIGNHPQIEELCQRLLQRKIEVAFSSLRADRLPDSLLQVIIAGGSHTLTLAPEVGSDALRRVANKHFSDEQYLQAAERSFAAGISHLKMYAMVGIPGENMDHLQALCDLAFRTRQLQNKLGRGMGRVTLSVGQLVPKPMTPFQWIPMLERSEAQKRFKFLEKQVSKLGGITFSAESPKWALIQGLLARGDRRWSQVIAAVSRNPGFSAWQSACKQAGIDIKYEAYRQRQPGEETFPWDHLAVEDYAQALNFQRRRAEADVAKLSLA